MKKEFDAMIKQHEGINGAYVEIPFDIQEAFGAKRVKVIATFDEYEYRGSIVSMGGCYLIGITQQIRKEINKDFGDLIHVTVEKDEEKREVDSPEDFTLKLQGNSTAQNFWNTLSFTNQKRYIDWIVSAKKEETRTERISNAVDLLAQGLKR